MEQRQTFISLSLDGERERVRKSTREGFDALKMIITISKSASEENVLPWLRPHPLSPAPYHLIQPHNGCRRGRGGPHEGGGKGGGIVMLRTPVSYSPNKQKDDEAHYSARLDGFCGRGLPRDDLADR